MKILLIQPGKPENAVGGEDLSAFEPLSLEYLAAGIAENHDVRILDMRYDSDLLHHLNDFKPHIVGITAYTVHVNTANKLFRVIKDVDKDIITVAGGHHATIRPEDFSHPAVDIIVRGEGVFPFREIVERIERKEDLSGIGSAIRDPNGVIVIGDAFSEPDLDSFPFPRRDLTKVYRNGYFSEWMRPLASIRTSKGCHFRCSFCALWKMTGGHYLTRKPECIVEELGTIDEPYVFFSDDESLIDADRMKALAGLIKSSGIKKRYFLYGRSDTISKHPDLLESWKEIGLERVFVGLEFGTDTHLRSIHKGSSVENNTHAVKILQGLGIDIFPTFIVKPDFTREDFAHLREYCLSLDLDFIGFSVLTPLPGTDLYEEVKDRLITFNYDHFDFIHTLLPTTLPMREFYKEFAMLYKKGRSMKNQFKLLRKYPLREIPHLFRFYNRFMKQLGTIHQDYQRGTA